MKIQLCFAILSLLVAVVVNGVPRHLIFNEHGISDHKEWIKRLQQLRVSARIISSLRRSALMVFTLSAVGLNGYQKLFDEYVSLFQREYTNDDEEYWNRFQIFVESLHRHNLLNTKEAILNGTATYGINKFSDWTPQEFQTLLSDQKAAKLPIHSYPIVARPKQALYRHPANNRKLPYEASHCSYQDIPYRMTVDWRSKVTRIKDQGECGSCWAFVGSEQVETYWAIKGNPVVELSPQELLSCSPSLGCEGGNTCAALSWLMKSGTVLETEQEYPYQGQDSACHRENKTRLGPQVQAVCGCQRLVDHEEIMLKVVDQKGPLSVNVDAVLWHDYVGGIIQHHCTNKKMNHAVQLVGYSLKDGPVPYWQAKNQWGTSFGENGYIRIKYGDNLCGIAEQPSFIVV